jgi:hypothetical protein
LNDASAVHSVRRLLSGDAVSAPGSQLCNPSLELVGLEIDRLDLTSLDLSVFSVEALEELLAGASFSIASEDELLKRLLNLSDKYLPLLRWIEIRFLSAAGIAKLMEELPFPVTSVWRDILDRLDPPCLPGRLQSMIVSAFPRIFEEFRSKHFPLLWRGSRHGFTARDFHQRCDGRENTLTVVLAMGGDIFGGFTPIAFHEEFPFHAEESEEQRAADISVEAEWRRQGNLL